MSYKRLDQQDITLSSDSIVTPLWTGNKIELSDFFTSQSQIGSNTGDFFHEVYDINQENPEAEVQFSIAFADKEGRGSLLFNPEVPGKSPSSVIYGQYRNLVFGDSENEFKFGTETSDYFYVINIDRARYREKLLPGSFNLTLKTIGTGEVTLTDDSKVASTISFIDAGRVFNIIEGINGVPVGQGDGTIEGMTWGKFLPDVGIIILNGKALDDQDYLELETSLGNNENGDNITKLFNVIDNGESFKGQSEETITSTFIYVRPRNAELNYSTNPSNLNEQGELLHDVMINSPRAYITTVGLYNDNNELVAVAKLSRPLPKDFTKEALIRIKLDY